VFNADHSLLGTPGNVLAGMAERARAGLEDALCALRYVAEHAGQYGGDPERITIPGHSASGLNGALAALGGAALYTKLGKFNDDNGFPMQSRCLAATEVPSARGFVSFNGALFIFSDDDSPFRPSSNSLVALLDPRTYVASASSNLRLRMILGGRDGQTPQWHKDEIRKFARDMHDRGHNSSTVLIENAGHDLTTSGPIWERTLAAVLAVTGN
jgi:pimeloyl-ACP methyl ester carboxylesterase